MNFVFLSPHFPPHYYRFCSNLRQLGVNVLGLADEPYDLLRPEQKDALTEYYRVNDMHSYDELVRALGYFTSRYGKLSRLDSLNEYWLETEAALRTDFNIEGLKTWDMARIKRKSEMKKVYQKAGVNVARGKIVQTLAEAKKLIKEIGYPVVAKPDVGVGAAKTFKIHNLAELESFFAQKPPVDYIMEEFIQGDILSFDGLTDKEGHIVFYTAHTYSSGIMEVVNTDDDVYYYSYRDIPADLEEAGRRVHQAFGVRERFFHFEFFRARNDGRIVALEVNMRPPGGLTTDMFNFANDIDIYREWANVMVFNRFTSAFNRKYHCCYIGRKNNRQYAHTHQDILDCFGGQVVYHGPMGGIFSLAMGDYCYIVRSPELGEIQDMATYAQALA